MEINSIIGPIGRVAAALFVIAVPLFLITASVTWAVNDPGVYHRGFEKYRISLYTGITDEDLRRAGADIRRYFNSAPEPLALRARVFGEERELFNSREVAHMKDVKDLIRGVYAIAVITGAYIVAGVATLWLWRRRSSRASSQPSLGALSPSSSSSSIVILARLFLWGGGLTLGLALATGLLALVGFDTLFLKFHQLSFSNDFWQLDPRTDYLVRMFPQGFWFDATMRVAITAVGGAAMVTLLSGGFLRFRRGRDRTGELTDTSGEPFPPGKSAPEPAPEEPGA